MDREWSGIKYPQIGSCCPGVPLRKGLLVLGYVTLVYHAILFVLTIYVALSLIIMSSMGPRGAPWEPMLLVPLLMASFIAFCVLMIVSGHTNNVTTLKITLRLGTILSIIMVLYGIVLFSRLLIDVSNYKSGLRFEDPLQPGIMLTFAIFEIVILGYALLVTHSYKIELSPESQRVGYIDLDKASA